MCIAKSVKTSSIPDKTVENKPNKELEKALKEADYMMKHSDKYKAYSSVEELFDALDNDD